MLGFRCATENDMRYLPFKDLQTTRETMLTVVGLSTMAKTREHRLLQGKVDCSSLEDKGTFWTKKLY